MARSEDSLAGDMKRHPYRSARRRRLVAAVAAVLLAGTALATGAQAQALPGAPTISQLTEGSGIVTLFWEVPSSTGGQTIDAYDVRHIETNATDRANANWTVEDNFWTSSSLAGRTGIVSNLVNGT